MTNRFITNLLMLVFISFYSVISFAQPMSQHLLTNEKNTISIVKRVSPFVVNVHNIQQLNARTLSLMQAKTGGGSGFIWDRLGDILTNYHVIHNAHQLAVTFADGETTEAKVIGVAARKDIAVLRIEDPKLLAKIRNMTPIPIANSAQLQVGQKTVVIGNPFGLDNTVTTGIISALHREVPGAAGANIREMIQTDASINPGNSGGPLLDSQGDFIGMNTVIVSSSGSSAGIGFAVPSNSIKRIVGELILKGKVTQPGIGVQLISDMVATQLGIHGAIVMKVLPGSPAQKAGLRGTQVLPNGDIILGDIITEANNQPVKNFNDLYAILENLGVNQWLTIRYVREGKPRHVKLKTVDLNQN